MGQYDHIDRLDEIEHWMSVQRAAETLQVDQSRVRQLIKQKMLLARRWSGHALMIDKASVTAYDTNRQGRGRPKMQTES